MKRFLSLFVAMLAAISIWAGNVITYTATSQISPNVSAFNESIIQQEFLDGFGTITFDADVTTIGDYAFYYSSSLTSVTIPESVTSIGDMAFYGCSSLASITIPESVMNIGESAFYGCSSLASIVWNPVNYAPTHWRSSNPFNGATDNVTSFTFGDNVETIPDRICNNMYALTSITIPESVTNIGSFAFDLCYSLVSVHISNVAAWCNIAMYDSGSNPLSNGASLYLNGVEVTDLVIPDGVTSINRSAFDRCSSITSVTIPSSVTYIGSNAFACENLTSVYISDLTAWCNISLDVDFYDGVFLDDADLHLYLNGSEVFDLVIPTGLTAINDYVFYGFKYLTSVSIPNSVTTIGESSFALCCGLADIYSYATIPPSMVIGLFSTPFYNVSKHCYVHVPAGTIRDYQMANGWSEFYHFYEMSELPGGPTSDQVGVVVTDNYATFSWPVNPTASSYTLTISKDGEVFCSLIFNSLGQLVGMNFAPARGAANNDSAETTAYGYSFVVNGLDAGNYSYIFTANDSNNNILETYTGSFVAIATGLNMSEQSNKPRKFIQNGQVRILTPSGVVDLMGHSL